MEQSIHTQQNYHEIDFNKQQKHPTGRKPYNLCIFII